MFVNMFLLDGFGHDFMLVMQNIGVVVIMRVCLVYIGGLTPRVGGGTASVINNIVRFSRDKIDYTLLTVYREKEIKEIGKLYPKNVKISYVKSSKRVFDSFLRFLFKRVDDFDVVHFHDFPFGRDLPLALRMCFRRKKLVYSHHISLEEFIHNRFLLGYYYSCLNFLGRFFKKVITNSRFVLENDLSRFEVLRDKVCVIRQGVDIDFIRGIKPLSLEGDPSIVFIGHLIYRKGIDLLLRAFHVLRSRFGFKVKLHIVGSGVLEKECKEYVFRHGLDGDVCFWGSVDEALKFRILKGADVLVLPSRYENLPVVLFEGMAAGKAIVATRVGGVSEVFKHGINGLLTTPNSLEIANSMRLLCENRDLISKFGENNVRAAVSFDWRNIVGEYVSLYHFVLG